MVNSKCLNTIKKVFMFTEFENRHAKMLKWISMNYGIMKIKV